MTPRSKLAGAPTEDADKSGIPRLTPREREVALALAEGLTRAHVAERMSVSVHTVSTLARRAYRKLGVTSQAALAARVARYEHKRLGER
jgi:DNA-binding CsgD family transcriptional regulator